MLKDELDAKLITLLQEKARLSFAQLGREVGLSASAVAERIQRLEETGVIDKYQAFVVPKAVGLPLSAYVSIDLGSQKYKQFIDVLPSFPEIVECSRVTGKDCLIMKVHLRDSKHLEEVIDRLAHYGNPSTFVVLSEVINRGNIIPQ